MVKLELFRSRAFSGANVFTLILFFAFNAVLFFLPMTLVSAWGRPEWEASLVMLPLSLAIAVFSGRAGRLADRIGPRLPLTAGARSMAIVLCRARADHAADAAVASDAADPAAQRGRHGDAGVAAVGGGDAGDARPRHRARLGRQQCGRARRRADGGRRARRRRQRGVRRRSSAPACPASSSAPNSPPALDPRPNRCAIAASNRAFQAIAAIASAMCFVAALIAWFTQPSLADAAEARNDWRNSRPGSALSLRPQLVSLTLATFSDNRSRP